MVRKHLLALCTLALCLTTVSCRKLGKPMGPLAFEAVKFTDAIPQNYGPLIGVTENPQSAVSFILWFQKSDGTITAVFVDSREGRIADVVLTIPRK